MREKEFEELKRRQNKWNPPRSPKNIRKVLQESVTMYWKRMTSRKKRINPREAGHFSFFDKRIEDFS